MLEQSLFIAITLAATIAIEFLFNKGSYSRFYAAGALALCVWYFGPAVFGREWFNEGFGAGMIFGGFLFHTLPEEE